MAYRRMGCFTAESELYAMTDDESRGTPSWTQHGMFHLQSPTWTSQPVSHLPRHKRNGDFKQCRYFRVQTSPTAQGSTYIQTDTKALPTLSLSLSFSLCLPTLSTTLSSSSFRLFALQMICHLWMIQPEEIQVKRWGTTLLLPELLKLTFTV